MIYDYDVYYRQNCIVPIILLLFALFLCGQAVYTFFKVESKRQLLNAIISLCIAVFLMIPNVMKLSRGGLFLLTEDESKAVPISGVIEDTIELPFYGGYKYGSDLSNSGRGEAIIVNGEKYYLTSCYDIKKGDSVVLYVLPHSKLVLKMERTGNNNG